MNIEIKLNSEKKNWRVSRNFIAQASKCFFLRSTWLQRRRFVCMCLHKQIFWADARQELECRRRGGNRAFLLLHHTPVVDCYRSGEVTEQMEDVDVNTR